MLRFISSKDNLFKVLIALYVGLAVFRLTDPTLKQVKSNNVVVKSQINTPTDIKIAKINLDLAISPSVVKGNDWQVFDDRIAWLSTSAFPLEGNTILYGHDRIGLFANLYKLKAGDVIQIYADKWIDYKVTQVKTIKPTDVNAILTNSNRLTLYTCSGSFDQKRLVVYAE